MLEQMEVGMEGGGWGGRLGCWWGIPGKPLGNAKEPQGSLELSTTQLPTPFSIGLPS